MIEKIKIMGMILSYFPLFSHVLKTILRCLRRKKKYFGMLDLKAKLFEKDFDRSNITKELKLFA